MSAAGREPGSHPTLTSSPTLSREIDETAATHLSPIRQGRENVFARELRVLRQNLFDSHSGSKKVEKQRNPNSRASDARFSKAYVWVKRFYLRAGSCVPLLSKSQD